MEGKQPPPPGRCPGRCCQLRVHPQLLSPTGAPKAGRAREGEHTQGGVRLLWEGSSPLIQAHLEEQGGGEELPGVGGGRAETGPWQRGMGEG